MLYITLIDGYCHGWHVGEKTPKELLLGVEKVSSIQADGDELIKIFNLFQINGNITIPFSTCPMNAWFGDTAKSILVALM